jgi:hypothetical protein
MSMSSHLTKRGIALWKSGKKTEARKIFETIIHNDKANETAWVWYIYALETNAEKIAALTNFLTIFPQHTTARRALVSLQEDELNIASKRSATSGQSLGASPPIRMVAVQKSLPGRKSESGRLPQLLLALGVCMLLFSSIVFIVRYNTLQTQYQKLEANKQLISQNLDRATVDNRALRTENLDLSSKYSSLMSRYDSLSSEHSTLLAQYSELDNRYTVLSGEYDTLSVAHVNLKNSYDELQAEYNNTVDSYDAFREIAIAPPYIYTRERNVHLVFRKLDGSLLHWTISSDWLEYHLRLGDQQRKKLAFDLKLYNDLTDETYHVVDDRKFVDASPFTNLMTDLYQQSPNDHAFINEVWNIVAQLTAYTTEMGETPRFPMETLLSGGGDCEDHAILFASMILASPLPGNVEFIYMDAENPTQPQTMNHVIVNIETANESYLVEATSKYSMNPYSDGVTGWSYTISRADN